MTWLISLLILSACNKDTLQRTPEHPAGAGNWNEFSVSEPAFIDQAGVDMRGYWPDGKISVVENDLSGKYTLYWGERYSFRTVAETPFPEDHISQVRPGNRVFGIGFGEKAGFTDGGAWFIGIYKLKDGRLAGFFHAESHWGGLQAYKSIGVAYSSDDGLTWTRGEKILNVDYPKPANPRWSGLGDGCVIYDEENERFICYYSAFVDNQDYKICMAISEDASGAPGTWKKWDGQRFSVEGYNPSNNLGGRDYGIAGLKVRSGANPSVMWNEYLKRWVMVYAGWNEVLYMSASDDGIAWERPIAITDVVNETARYPNLISENGDLKGGSVVKLYYGRNQNSAGVRQFALRTITYDEQP
ncbi:hypothetical protein ACFOET_16810 [Parapedobacter deserti]|uniref:DUF4185 domain-containing protein n=1 Tax=Parapedobacter deserti TaxID=1912957 RepID=A0ABV7JQP4_9SPHI